MKTKSITTGLAAVASLILSLQSNATIISGSGTGGWQYLNDPSGLSVGDDTFQDNILRGFDEDQNVIFDNDVTAFTSWNWNNATVSGTDALTISSGTEVASHYILFDPRNAFTIDGWVEFDAEILGIITDTDSLLATDSLINNDVTYLNPGLRGLENYQDWVRIDPSDSNRIQLHFTASTPGDYIRVLTKHSVTADVPEPAILLLLSAGLAGIGFTRRKNR